MTSPGYCTNCGISHPLNYVILDGKCLCEGCWHKMFPYCKSCGERLTQNMNIAYFKDKKGLFLPYCPRCAKNPVCCCCGLPIRTGHKKIVNGNIFCSECVSAETQGMTFQIPICCRCGQQIRTGHKKIVNGNIFCSECIPAETQETIFQISEAWLSVCKFMQQKFNFCVRSPFPKLVTRKQLFELLGNPNVTQEAGFYRCNYTVKKNFFSLCAGQKIFSECQIYLLKGLTLETSEEILAHEAGHDLLDSIFPMFSDKVHSEGFAQYIASEYNTFCGRSSRNELIFSNDDPVYGDGARIVRNIVARTGYYGLINCLRRLYHE